MTKLEFNSRFPLESFDPRYRTIWLKAAVGEIRFDFPSEKEAQAFQIRIHMYRSKLKKSGDVSALTMYRAKSSRKGATLFLRPADAKFIDILERFDVPNNVAPSTQTALSPLAATSPIERGLSVDELFSDFDLKNEGNLE